MMILDQLPMFAPDLRQGSPFAQSENFQRPFQFLIGHLAAFLIYSKVSCIFCLSPVTVNGKQPDLVRTKCPGISGNCRSWSWLPSPFSGTGLPVSNPAVSIWQCRPPVQLFCAPCQSDLLCPSFAAKPLDALAPL
jgi:hypothetical protein